MKAYLCIHQSALKIPKKYYKEFPIQTKEKWRIRNLKDHPNDPGWERSRYCQCHRVLRESSAIWKKFREEAIYIIDAVRIERKKHAIRSMFKITDVRQCLVHSDSKDLLFKDYFFAPKNPAKVLFVQKIKGLENYNGVQVKKLDSYNPEKIVEKILKTYEHVLKGKKPSSLHSKDWKQYLMRHDIKHMCG